MHVFQYKNKLPSYGYEGERQAMQMQLDLLVGLQAPQHTINHLKKILDSGYDGDMNKDGKFDRRDYDARTW